MINSLPLNRKSNYKITFFSYVLIVFVFLLMFNPCNVLLTKLFADDASYLSHGFTLGLDFNFKYKDSIATWVVKDNIPSHPIGPGVLAAPFITLFSMIDRITDNPVIANHHQYLTSWSYFGFIFATFFYFISGLWLYYVGLKRLLIPLSAKHFLFIASSFGLLVYVLFRPVLAVAYEFFTIGLCFWSSINILTGLKEKKVPYLMLMICALSIIFTLLIRPSNINIYLLPFIIFGFAILTNKQFSNVKMNQSVLKSMAVLLGLIGGFTIVTCFINQLLYGMYFPSPQALYGLVSPSKEVLKYSVITKDSFDFQQFIPLPSIHNYHDVLNAIKTLLIRSPKIAVVLFSSEFGMAYNSTILVVGTMMSLAFLACKLKIAFLKSFTTMMLLGIYIAIPLAIILFWQYAGSIYGYRFMFCVFPIAIMGFAAGYNNVIERYGRFSQFPKMIKLCLVIFWFLCAFGLIASAFWYLNPYFTDHRGVNSFGIDLPHSNSINYNFFVLVEFFQMQTWYEMIITRTIGFYYAGLLEMLHIPFEHSGFFKMENINLKMFHCSYVDLPGRIYLQVTIFGALFMGSGLLLCRQDFKT